MTKYVKNDGGTVHSVPDDFELPEGWEDATEKDASPELLGTAADPAVAAVEIHDPDGVVPDTNTAETPADEAPAEAPEVTA